MASLSDNLKPPYYAAIIDSKINNNIDEPANEGDQLVALAVRRPGFLGLETARAEDGRPVTVSYWRDLSDVENWQTASGAIGQKAMPLEVCRVANSNDKEFRIS